MQLCDLLWGLLSTVAIVASNVVSYALDNWGALAEWWYKLPALFKVIGYALVTVVIGAGLWAVGRYGFSCPAWPSNAEVWTMILAAALSFFTGAFRHERSKA